VSDIERPTTTTGAAPTTGVLSARWLEIVAAVLLSAATLATAWSGYQASRWNGEQAKATARANAARVESTRASGLANRNAQIDIALFIQWVDAYATGEQELTDFYRRRFREEFKPAFDAWIATRPLQNPRAPLSPFAMPQYVLAAEVESRTLEATAEMNAAEARRNIQRATNYVLAVTFFAASLFFAGISTRLTRPGPRVAILGLGCVLFVVTLVWVATSPVSVSV
jgi:hypothetical protein